MLEKERPKKLTHSFVKSIAWPGRFGDGRGGHGLSLLVRKTAKVEWSKTWSQSIRIAGEAKPTVIGLGSFPIVSLAMARDQAFLNARRVARGEDIRIPKRTIPTVTEAFEKVIILLSPGWTSETEEYRWRLSLRKYCKSISDKLVSRVTRDDVRAILTPLWHDKNRTARVVRSHLSAVMQWAIDEGHRDDDPAGPRVTRGMSRPPKPNHHPSIDFDKLGAALDLVLDAKGWWAAKYCLIFLALTCVRSGEARKAKWDEIDFAKATWTIPAIRMKNRIEHKVPLATQVLEVLDYAWDQSNDHHGFIFPPKRRGKKKYMGSGILCKFLHRLGIAAVPHGLRSSFRNWSGVRKHIPAPAAEMVLAHAPDKATVAAYLTSDFFEDRVPIMQEYADYLTEKKGPVINATPRAKEDPSPKIKSKHAPGTIPRRNLAAVQSTDQPAGKPENGTTASTAGPTPKRSKPAGKPESTDGRRKDSGRG